MSFVPAPAAPVEDLGVDTHQACWLGQPARDRLAQEAAWAGLSLGPSDDLITHSPGSLVSAYALRDFERASRGIAGDVLGVLAPPLDLWCDHPALGRPARLLRLRGGAEGWSAERAAQATLLQVQGDHYDLPGLLADVPGGRSTQLPLSNHVLCPADHYAGLLWANLISLGPALWRALVGPLWAAPLRLAWGALRALSVQPFQVAGALNRVQRGARIHPSAVVEGVWLGPGASVGPGAVVRGSILGAGARVEAQALVAFSVLGPEAVVQRRGWVQYGLLDAGAAHGGAMQLGVLGPGSAVKGGAYLLDQGLPGREVRASVRGSLHPAPLGVLGVGLGAGSMVGSGVWVAAGRAVPPRSTLLADPALVKRGPWVD